MFSFEGSTVAFVFRVQFCSSHCFSLNGVWGRGKPQILRSSSERLYPPPHRLPHFFGSLGCWLLGDQLICGAQVYGWCTYILFFGLNRTRCSAPAQHKLSVSLCVCVMRVCNLLLLALWLTPHIFLNPQVDLRLGQYDMQPLSMGSPHSAIITTRFCHSSSSGAAGNFWTLSRPHGSRGRLRIADWSSTFEVLKPVWFLSHP